ncbi:hypothetical protein Bca4012_073022 [Brassica carinata]|uniref:Uncharacterized protein n=1 Tax=Brassica carinata TaxID=52824 RepID=A0A8X7QNA1_BRACI|nr:hypothetical protein Bca52824_065368 [Brassica carinata]
MGMEDVVYSPPESPISTQSAVLKRTCKPIVRPPKAQIWRNQPPLRQATTPWRPEPPRLFAGEHSSAVDLEERIEESLGSTR